MMEQTKMYHMIDANNDGCYSNDAPHVNSDMPLDGWY